MSKRYTNNEIIEMVNLVDNGDYQVIHLDEKGSRQKKRQMQYLHKLCNNKSNLFPLYEFISDGVRRCKICYPSGEEKSKRLSFSYDKVKQNIESVDNGEYLLRSKSYINSKKKLRILHKTCNREFEKSLEKLNSGQRCKWCNEGVRLSKSALYVYDIFNHFNIEIESEKTFERCKNDITNNYLPFDYYLPQINQLIEVDGEHHTRNSFNDKNNWSCISK